MSGSTPALPGYWHFAWMFFMQPVTLHHRLKAAGVNEPGISGWRYWRRRHELTRAYGDYLRRLITLLFFVPVVCVVALGLISASPSSQSPSQSV